MEHRETNLSLKKTDLDRQRDREKERQRDRERDKLKTDGLSHVVQ